MAISLTHKTNGRATRILDEKTVGMEQAIGNLRLRL